MLPNSAIVYLSNYCDLSCTHCFMKLNSSLNTANIDIETMKRTIDDFKENKMYLLAFTGGDPLLHPEIYEILQYTRNSGILPLLGTTGTRITIESAKQIYNSGVRCVQLSLDGANEKTNSIYRGANVFEKIDTAIDILKSEKLLVNLAFCISKENIADVSMMLNYANTKQIHQVKIAFWDKMGYACDSLNEIDVEEKRKVIEICKAFEIKLCKKEWIFCDRDEEQDIVNLHSSAIIIDSYGSVKLMENSESIGNIKEDKVSNIYAKYLEGVL